MPGDAGKSRSKDDLLPVMFGSTVAVTSLALAARISMAQRGSWTMV